MYDYASKEHVIAALSKGVRLDGRKLTEMRDITIEVDCIRNAEGSAKVSCGDNVVIAGVKMAVGTPYSDSPDSGVLMVNAELLPMSNPDFESGPPSIESIEVSRVVDRGIRESGAIDSKGLCITAGEAVWMVNVDITPLNTDGGLFDVSGLASIAALLSARFPKLEDGKVNYKELTDEKVPVKGMPIPVTICKIGDQLIVDPTYLEWKLVDARLTVTTLDDGTLCALQKGGAGTLSIEEVDEMIGIAVEKSNELRNLVKKALK